MGQPNGKEAKVVKQSKTAGKVVGRKNTTGTQTVAMRVSTMRENVLQNSPHYHDPMGTKFVSGSGEKLNKIASAESACAANSNFAKQKRCPVVLRYSDKNAKELLAKKQKVQVILDTLEWKPVLMAPSEESFYAILELPPGTHRFRFIVNDREVVDSTQPVAEQSTADGDLIPANVLQLNDTFLMTKEDEEIMDDGEGWGQEHYVFEETKKYPPIVPVHLRYTPLNTPYNAVRCSRDGVLSKGEIMPPEHLPLPLNVTINHVYFQRREDHSVMGLTTRYCNKYTTLVYYSTVETHDG